jgi:hypothetical protein
VLRHSLHRGNLQRTLPKVKVCNRNKQRQGQKRYMIIKIVQICIYI